MIIERNIPIPKREKRGYSQTLQKMKSGDSVAFETKKEAQSFYATAHSLKLHVAMRKMGTEYRIWYLGEKEEPKETLMFCGVCGHESMMEE